MCHAINFTPHWHCVMQGDVPWFFPLDKPCIVLADSVHWVSVKEPNFALQGNLLGFHSSHLVWSLDDVTHVLLHQFHTTLALCHAREPPRVLPQLYKTILSVVSADLVHWFVSESNFALQANLYCPHYMWWVSHRRFQTGASPGIARVKFWSIVLIAYHYIVSWDDGTEPSVSKDNRPVWNLTVRGRDRIFLHP